MLGARWGGAERVIEEGLRRDAQEGNTPKKDTQNWQGERGEWYQLAFGRSR
jgi:hypothetical protein